MSITKRIFNNVFWLGLSEASSRVLFFLGTVYLARVLGKAGFGFFSLSVAVGIYFWVIADMGVTGYGTREVARNRERTVELYSILNSLRFFLAISLFLIFCGILYFIDIPLQTKIVLLAGSFYAVAFSLSADWVFRGLEKMQYIIIGRAATSIFFVGGIYLFVKTPLDIIPASTIYSCSFLLGSLIFIFILSKKLKIPFSLRISFNKWLSHIKNSFYFAVNSGFNNVSLFIPIFFMGLWSTHDEIGIFSAPHRLIMMVIHAGTLIMLALYPTLSDLYVTDREKFKQTCARLQKLIIGTAMPVSIVASMFGKDIIVFLYGASFVEGGAIFNILIWLVFLVVLRSCTSIALFSAGFQRFNMFATGAGATVVTLTSIALIPRYGGYGAVWALIGGEFLTLVLMIVIFRQKVYRSGFLMSFFIKVLLTSTIMVLLVINLPFSTLMNALLGILFYGLLSLSIGIISKKTIHQFYLSVLKQ